MPYYFPFGQELYPLVQCSGKLKLDTEGVIFVQKLYNGRRPQNIFWTKRTPKQTGDLP